MDTIQFPDRKTSKEYYDDRYRHGYMGHWSRFEKERIFELVRGLNLPATGHALDFGCGRGIFTEIISEALPGWKVYGCDLSAAAIESAKHSKSNVTFFVLGDPGYASLKFDFIHSHHVMEHTFDLRVTAEEMNAFAAPKCTMLHSLPCNHEGSLEYKLAHWTKDGFDPATGKFFFEDTAHLRRLQSVQAEALFAPFDFRMVNSYFSNQYWGAIKWIAESDLKLASSIAFPSHAKNPGDYLPLISWWVRLSFAWICFFAAGAFTRGDVGPNFILKKIFQLFFFVALFPIALPAKYYINRKAEMEWKKKNREPNGSEMFLVFRR